VVKGAEPDGQTVTVRGYSPLVNETKERETFVVPAVP
jgi:hypothetical protein